MSSEQPDTVSRGEPNAVLRGGPYDGRVTQVHPGWPPIIVQSGDQDCMYRPTGATDEQYPTLTVYVFADARAAV